MVRRALVRRDDRDKERLAERRTDELQADREPVAPEAAGEEDRWKAGEVPRRNERRVAGTRRVGLCRRGERSKARRAAVERGADGRRGGAAAQADEHIDLREDPAEPLHEHRSQPHRPQVVAGADLGPLAQAGLLARVDELVHAARGDELAEDLGALCPEYRADHRPIREIVRQDGARGVRHDPAELGEAPLQRAPCLRRRVLEILLGDAGARASDGRRGRAAGARAMTPPGERGVGGVPSSDGLEDDAAVLGGPGHRADLVEGPGQRHRAGAAHQAIGGTKSGDPAERRRGADRPRGLRAEREREDPRTDRGARAARRSAGPALRVPGIPSGSLERRARIAIAATAGKLDHRELRREDRARSPEPADDRRVLIEDLIAVRRRAPGRRRAGGGDQVLRPVRDAGERRARGPARDRPVGTGRLGEGALPHERGDRVETPPIGLEQRERRLGELDRRDPLTAKRRRELGDGGVADVDQGRKTVGGSSAIGTSRSRSAAAFFSAASRIWSASTAGSSFGTCSLLTGR